MEQQNTFSYTYNAPENQEALNIRKEYLPRQKTELETLKALHAKVKKPANVFAYTYGSVSAVIMGAGMSLIMTNIAEVIGLGADPMIPGIVIGVVGMAMALINYPIYKAILNARKKKHAQEILALSEKIMNQ